MIAKLQYGKQANNKRQITIQKKNQTNNDRQITIQKTDKQ